MKYLSRPELELSPIVANNRMNRERQVVGVNSYQKEVGFNLVEWLINREGEKVRWLDICCGNGNALIQALEILESQTNRVELVGVDLVGMFLPFDSKKHSRLDLIEASIFAFQPDQSFDLITCIHGIHYLGDKLLLLSKAANWLKEDGLFLGSLDFENIRDRENHSLGKWLRKEWKSLGWDYQLRNHLLTINGKSDWPLKWQYLGASDQAGPNYSGQEAVNSFYEVLHPSPKYPSYL